MSFVPNRASNLAIAATFLFSFSTFNALAGTKVSRLPLTFEQNQGQASTDIKFVSRGASGVLYLGAKEISMRAPGKDAAFRLKLLGASDASAVLGTGEATGTVNYFRGSDPSKWLTNIASFSKVTYKNIYPSVDLIVYGNEGQFESDFVIAENADPSAIALHIDGRLEIRNDGSIAIQSAGSAFQLHKPFVYQYAAGGERVAVDCRYTISGNQVGFALGSYDRSKSLVIDPVLTSSTYLGGTGQDQVLGMANDLLGNVYVVGVTNSTNFPTAHPIEATEAGGNDCFVSKLDPTGQHLLYSTYLGGSAADKCTSVAVNLLGEAFVGGTTSSTNFPTQNPLQSALKGTGDGFVAHLDCTGTKLIFSTYLGGGGEFLTGVALDLLSNVYVTGVTDSINYPVTPGAYQTVCGKGTAATCFDNAFLSKISPDGCHLIFSTYLGGSTNYDSANGVSVDLTGSPYVTGEAHSSDFPTTKGAFQSQVTGIGNAFVTKFSPNGSSLVYSTLIGGSGLDSSRSIAVDLFGDAYIAGSTSSLNYPLVNPVQTTNKSKGGYSPSTVFVTKLNPAGSALIFSTYFGGSVYDYPFAISLDLLGNANVMGETSSPDFPTKSPIQGYAGGFYGYDAFAASFSSKGAVNFSTFLGGTNDDYAFAGSTDLFGCIWVGGVTYSTDFPTKNPYQAKSMGNGDAFVTHITTP